METGILSKWTNGKNTA